MMKIGKYISELLFTSDFVVLPGFGEFTPKYIPARFVPEKKKVEAPSKIVAFSTKNKTDDKNVLAEYMAKQEGTSLEKAKEFVSSFVNEMNNSLKSGKKVELESIGQFSMAPNGVIEFDPDSSINYLSDSAGLKSVKEPEKKEPTQAKTDADKVLDKANEVKKEDKKEIGADAKPVDKLKPEETGKKPSESTAFKPINEKKGLPAGLKWVAFLVAPILVIGIVFAFTHEYFIGDKAIDIKSLFTKKDQPTEVIVPVVDREPLLDAEDIIDQTTETTATPSTPEPGRRVYYIIVGSFEEEHNAHIYVDELQRKGAVNAKAFPKNPLGFYRVSYGFYYDLREAEQILTTVQQTENADAWILHR